MSAIVKAVIPVAGMGTRLLPATKSQPKEMLPVGRRPVVQYVVEELEQAGLDQILFVTGRKKSAIEDHFDADPELVRVLSAADSYTLLDELAYTSTEASYFYTRQSTPLGLADAVRRAERFVGDDNFVVALGDSIIKNGSGTGLLAKMVEVHLSSGAGCTIALEHVSPEETYRYGIVAPVAGADTSVAFEIDDLVEKPAPGAAPSTLAIAARYVFSPMVFEAIRRTAPDRKGELQLTDSIRLLKQLGQRIMGVTLQPGERRYDIGNFESYFTTFIDFALADEKYGYMVRQYLKRKAREL
ncbi:MAG: UTP--glucose-1-phosphate uridylyltransferase [Anaerolineae bacterium]|jgi:UTP--glucose-1-phosphate uridylyltransferase|nr:UTP--glucose-1-phosphate uridylyltransferase [Chloroflexota bacterium]